MLIIITLPSSKNWMSDVSRLWSVSNNCFPIKYFEIKLDQAHTSLAMPITKAAPVLYLPIYMTEHPGMASCSLLAHIHLEVSTTVYLPSKSRLPEKSTGQICASWEAARTFLNISDGNLSQTLNYWNSLLDGLDPDMQSAQVELPRQPPNTPSPKSSTEEPW